MPINTLAAIQQKVRRLTRSPSTAVLSDTDLNNYINTYVVYDFAEHLRQFINKTTFTFYCNPYQDIYPTDIIGYGLASNAVNQPLYNFQNKYLTIHPPVFMAGFNSFFTQSREQFYGIYPMLRSISSIGVYGDGVTTGFSGIINYNQPGTPPNINNNITQQVCLLKNNVLFESVDVNGNGLSMIDSPILDAVTGNPTIWGQLYPPDLVPNGTTIPYILATAPYVVGTNIDSSNYINYFTGAFTVTFPVAPRSYAAIQSQTVPSIVSLPQAMCYYNNTFIIRPIPDQPYAINFECYIRPSELLATNQAPQLEEWWQLIAYGASMKIFQDRMDLDSVNMIMPEYDKQERLCLRRTLVQLSNQRTPTIYTEQTGLNSGNNGFGWGSTGF